QPDRGIRQSAAQEAGSGRRRAAAAHGARRRLRRARRTSARRGTVNRSIRIRLLVSLLALLIPLSAGAAWLLIQVFGNRLLHDIDVTLGEEAETVAELLATPVSWNTVEDLLNHIAGEPEHGAQKYITITRDGQLVSEAPRGAERLIAAGDPRLRVVRYAAPR